MATPFKNSYSEIELTQAQVGSWPAGSLWEVVDSIARNQSTCQLAVAGQDIADRFKLTFVGGLAQHSSKFLDSRDVLVMLQKSKMLTPVQIHRIQEQVRKTDCTVRRAAVDLKILTDGEIAAAVRKKLNSHYGRMLKLPSGQFQIATSAELGVGEGNLETRADDLIYRGILAQFENLSPGRLDACMTPLLKKFPIPEQPEFAHSDWDANELRLWSVLMKASFNVGQVVGQSPFDRAGTYLRILALRVARKIKFTEVPQALANPSSGQDGANLFRQFMAANAFEKLGLHWTSAPTLLQGAYQKRREDLGGQRDLLGANLVEMLRELDSAYQLLSDKEKRREYRRGVVDDTQLQASAELFYKKAQTAVLRADFKEAATLLATCIDLEPNNATYLELFRKVGGSRG